MRKEAKRKTLPDSTNLQSMVQYIASRNPNGVRMLAYKYGYPNFNTYTGSQKFINHFLRKEGEKGLDELVMQHPDKELMMEVYFSKFPQKLDLIQTPPVKVQEVKSPEATGIQMDYKPFVNTLGMLIAIKKDDVIRLLNTHRALIQDTEDLREIAQQLLKQLQTGNHRFQQDLAVEISDFLNPGDAAFLPEIVSGIGKVVGGIIGNKKSSEDAPSGPNANDVAITALNYKISQQQQKQKALETKKKQENLVLMLGIGGSVLVLIVIILILTHKI